MFEFRLERHIMRSDRRIRFAVHKTHPQMCRFDYSKQVRASHSGCLRDQEIRSFEKMYGLDSTWDAFNWPVRPVQEIRQPSWKDVTVTRNRENYTKSEKLCHLSPLYPLFPFLSLALPFLLFSFPTISFSTLYALLPNRFDSDLRNVMRRSSYT